MRLAAAFLVVAIHISPFADRSAAADFLLTRVVARLAVPFFFMASGYFTLSRYDTNGERLRRFLQKTAALYAAGIALYLPLSVYGGYFSGSIPDLFRKIVFDGTMYHLWYLPAAMLGMLIARHLMRRLDYPAALAVAAALYLVGLFGDSYYGLAANVPVLGSLYDVLFTAFSYTRNGLFFAPIFLLLGGALAEKKRTISLPAASAGLAVSMLFMTAEALLLRRYDVPRHDSMTIFLLPSSWFLFQILLCFKGRRVRGLRTASMLIYLVHPMMIVLVRGLAKALHLQKLLVEDHLVFYLLVCVLSAAFGFGAAVIRERFGRKKRHDKRTERAYLEVNLDRLAHNAAVLQSAMPKNCELMAVVKARAYGHGACPVAAHLEQNGVKAFAVATIDEGIELRHGGIRGEILVLGFTDERRAKDLKKYRLTQTLIDFSYAERLNRQNVPVRAHLAVDSGMHRLGIAADDLASVRRIFRMKNLKVDGIFTHLCCADSLRPDDRAFTEEQICRFYALIDRMKAAGLPIPKIHIQSSYGLLNEPKLRCDYVRAGIALYGVRSAPNDQTLLRLDLLPALSLKSRVVLLKNVSKGEAVGYGRAFCARRDSRIAIVPVGYGDGFPRNLSDTEACVRIGETLCPIVGRICMDQLAVDVTDMESVNVGDEVVLIDDKTGSPIDAAHTAARAGSISNELLCRMGARLPIVYRCE